MAELTRQTLRDDLDQERQALAALLARLNDREWHQLTRDDGWRVHDVVAHIADVYLSTLATGGLTPGLTRATVGVTLPMTPEGRVNVERLNMLRFQANRALSRDEVMQRLNGAMDAAGRTIDALDDARLLGPGPYGPPETMREWFEAMVAHSREHRLQLERIYAARRP